jgi:hypothetical protein
MRTIVLILFIRVSIMAAMNVEELIKALQKIQNKKLPVGVDIQGNLPFTYEVTGASLESSQNLNPALKVEKPDSDQVLLSIKITPR